MRGGRNPYTVGLFVTAALVAVTAFVLFGTANRVDINIAVQQPRLTAASMSAAALVLLAIALLTSLAGVVSASVTWAVRHAGNDVGGGRAADVSASVPTPAATAQATGDDSALSHGYVTWLREHAEVDSLESRRRYRAAQADRVVHPLGLEPRTR